ncbi:MAG: hypothetical protein ACYDEQ_00640 [Desulfocucumaceae bacterium]
MLQMLMHFNVISIKEILSNKLTMDYKSINLRKINKEDLIKSLLQGEFAVPSKKEKEEIQKKIEIIDERGDYLVVRNALILGIYFETENTFSNIRKKGIFRYCNYIAKKCIILNLATELLEISQQLGCLSNNDFKYLKSIIHLSNLHQSYNKLQNIIIKEINSFQREYPERSLIKSLLSFVDYLFLSDYSPSSKTDPMKFDSRTKEEICSAVSYIIYFTTTIKTAVVADTNFVSEDYIKSGEIEHIIIAACLMSDFKEFEILVSNFNYECVETDGKLKIIPPKEDFEKSIRLGYIRREIQSYNDRINAEEAGSSLEDLVDEINSKGNFNFFQLTKTYNYHRYTVEMPEPVYKYIVDTFLKPNHLFKEEIIYLSHIFKEQLLNYDDLNKIKIVNDLSLMEFIKIRRIFYLFYLLFTKQIFKKEKVNTDILFRSLIPSYREDVFYNMIEKITTRENIRAYLEIVCWKPGMDRLFDLQYHPILFMNDHFLIPLSVLVTSNMIRNLFASEYKQNNVNLLTDGSNDALVEKLHKSFGKANIQSYKQISINKTDIDVIAIYENTLFVFECKQSLHPVSIFDLRTIFDYIKKAENQLDYITQELFNGNLAEILKSKYNIDLNKIKQIVPGIILNDRLFNGNVFKYPIRNIHEIENILERGTMRTDEGVFKLWKNDKLSLFDLVDYFSSENKLVKLFYDSFSFKPMTYRLIKQKLEVDSYYLDLEKAKIMLKVFTSSLVKIEQC